MIKGDVSLFGATNFGLPLKERFRCRFFAICFLFGATNLLTFSCCNQRSARNGMLNLPFFLISSDIYETY